jgi:hypothetical protein
VSVPLGTPGGSLLHWPSARPMGLRLQVLPFGINQVSNCITKCCDRLRHGGSSIWPGLRFRLPLSQNRNGSCPRLNCQPATAWLLDNAVCRSRYKKHQGSYPAARSVAGPAQGLRPWRQVSNERSAGIGRERQEAFYLIRWASSSLPACRSTYRRRGRTRSVIGCGVHHAEQSDRKGGRLGVSMRAHLSLMKFRLSPSTCFQSPKDGSPLFGFRGGLQCSLQ